MASLQQLVVHFCPWVTVRQGNLDGFTVEFSRKIDGALDGFRRLTRQADDEVSVDRDAEFLAVLRKPAAHLCRCAFFDVFQDLIVAGFKADDEKSSAAVSHGLQSFIIAVNAGRAGPAETQRLELL